MKLHLVDDWRKAWRWFSVWAMALAGAMVEAWNTFPATMQSILPEKVAHAVAVAVLVLGILGRIVKQGGNPPAGQGGQP